MIESDFENKELPCIFNLFFEELPIRFEQIDTSRGDKDFRETIIAEWKSGEKYVIKLSENDFTYADKIKMWKRCAEEYRNCGYYCPAILYSIEGDFPTVPYKGHNCIAYAEEYCKYAVAQERTDALVKESLTALKEYRDAAFQMTAKIAAKQFDFTKFPSGYCLFDTFCSSDATDEVLENALKWKKYAENLPAIFQTQVHRIWNRWLENRNELEKIYSKLPTSVFQADLNPTNLLLDDNGNFVGVFDFNLCGKDVFLNYLLREIYWFSNDEDEINYILKTLKSASEFYCFSAIEKRAIHLLYRCIKPLWYTKIEKLKSAGDDMTAIKSCLDDTEKLQTRIIDFETSMG